MEQVPYVTEAEHLMRRSLLLIPWLNLKVTVVWQEQAGLPALHSRLVQFYIWGFSSDIFQISVCFVKPLRVPKFFTAGGLPKACLCCFIR